MTKLMFRNPSWWLSGGIDAANCVAAYKAKGAASYVTSKVNLTGNAAYDLVDTGHAPSWDATGWYFPDTRDKYLDTGFIPLCTYSVIVRVSDQVQAIGGEAYNWFGAGAARYFIEVYGSPSLGLVYGNNGYTTVGGYPTEGIFGLLANTGWQENSKVVAAIDGYSPHILDYTLLIGGRHYPDDYLYAGCVGKIQAMAVYNYQLTDAQYLAVWAAMGAL